MDPRLEIQAIPWRTADLSCIHPGRGSGSVPRWATPDEAWGGGDQAKGAIASFQREVILSSQPQRANSPNPPGNPAERPANLSFMAALARDDPGAASSQGAFVHRRPRGQTPLPRARFYAGSYSATSNSKPRRFRLRSTFCFAFPMDGPSPKAWMNLTIRFPKRWTGMTIRYAPVALGTCIEYAGKEMRQISFGFQ
jgi:hypothetical protein